MAACQLSSAETLSDPRLGSNARLDAIAAAVDWAPRQQRSRQPFGYVRALSANFATNMGQAFCFATTFNLRRAAGLIMA
jgi:hypothetical protein